MTRKNLTLLIVVILVSMLGGVAGGVLVRSYLLNASFDVPLFGDINLGGQYDRGNLVISQPKNVIVEQDERVRSVVDQSAKSLLQFYKRKPQISPTADAPAVITDKILAAHYYTPQDILGTGLALTSDGWLITAVKIDAPAAVIAVDDTGELLAVEQVVFDDVSGYTFVKLSADNLVAVQFYDASKLNDGQLVVALDGAAAVATHITASRHYQTAPLLRASEQTYRTFVVRDESLARGAVVVGLDGAVIGLYDAAGVVTPINEYARLLPGLLNEGRLTRPSLGVHYINLSELVGPRKLAGALVAGDNRHEAVVKAGAAAMAGIQAGDIILSVDGRAVTAGETLSELVQSRQPGDELEIRLQRGEQEEVVKVVLTGVE